MGGHEDHDHEDHEDEEAAVEEGAADQAGAGEEEPEGGRQEGRLRCEEEGHWSLRSGELECELGRALTCSTWRATSASTGPEPLGEPRPFRRSVPTSPGSRVATSSVAL